jgi:hypothetical protein
MQTGVEEEDTVGLYNMQPQTSRAITAIISVGWNFTTKSGGIWNGLLRRVETGGYAVHDPTPGKPGPLAPPTPPGPFWRLVEEVTPSTTEEARTCFWYPQVYNGPS